MRAKSLIGVLILLLLVVPVGGWAQETTAPAQHEQHPQSAPKDPRAAEAEETGPALMLEELERMALAGNPTLRQASAEVRVAAGRAKQAGLYPNPTVGYLGEEIRGGRSRGGQQGFFIEQPIVLGGKLKRNRQVFEQERVQAEAESDEQRLRVMNAVRMLYFHSLAAQEAVTVRRKLARLAAEAVEVSQQLYNVGQADQPDVLQAEIEAQRAELMLIETENRRQHAWTALAAVVGNPQLPLTRLAGRLEENLPEIAPEQYIEDLVRNSPAVRIAEAGVKRAELAVGRARSEAVPDLVLRGGLQQNRELLEATGRPVGLQGFAEIGVQLKLFDRNQGGVESARAELERAQAEARRVELVLRERSAGLLRSYRDASAMVERYRAQMIPRAQRAYELYLAKYQEVAAAYPQVLISQRTLFQLQTDYIEALEALQTSSIALRGYLLTDGLEAPARAGEMDQPVREINVPMARPMEK
ncbi:MAG TPA: TolC family protein [Terriglobales bacterium]|nr:TolC family protein [Terriglobales bacterium]